MPLAAITSTFAADGWRFCEDIAGQVGEQAVVEACRPIAATDLVPVVLPIAVLLFPQIAELTIPGVISLKQRVARQEEEQRRLQQDVVRVQQQVSQRVINVMNIDVDEFWKKAAQFVREDGP